ncbi:MAG: bifunctional (p)ppGpp synthetase/guanosine-3',5'-bis(diphosphate) 3'-pyrophosphohydrolase [Cocleimonas sp.]|nr:bifunctional (p)ppGpp synthetase/guanosine-3',5'-bis(diphosphate) 3'-pyrophosphohydrolase [Cocleimonas sp.]
MKELYIPYFCNTASLVEVSKLIGKTLKISHLCEVIEQYLSRQETCRIYDAFLFAAEAHNGVTRKSGEAYIFHPLTVAYLLADMHMDADTICAALLHDVIEDTEHTKLEITQRFGQKTADLVDGVTKLASGEFTDRESASAASFHKMMVAMTHDFRVVLIKLADRQHNINTLGSMPRLKQRRISLETLNIHVPLARRMGMNAMRTDLQMTAFEHLHPWRFKTLQKMMQVYNERQGDAHIKIRHEIIETLADKGIDAELPVWKKNLYRLYLRIKSRKGKKYINQYNEPLQIRILVNDKMNCYQALGVIHGLYHPKIGTFKDFIATPKIYGFQAIETSVTTPRHQLVRVLIQSRQMHYLAQYGITSHWRFPEMEDQVQELHKHLDRWLMQVEDIQKTHSTDAEFLEDMKADLFLNEIYISTPKGDTKILPNGATPVDFAYAIHSKIGHHCLGAYVNDRRVPLNLKLYNGATVKIITDKTATPQPAWLKFVVTGKARSAIRYWIKSTKAEDFQAMGRRLLQVALKTLQSDLNDIPTMQWKKILCTLSLKNKTHLFYEIAKGNQCSKLVSRRLLNQHGDLIATHPNNKALIIKSTEGLAVNLQHCCHPIPGDTLLAMLDPEIGLAVHRVGCPRLLISSENTFSLAWRENTNESFLAPIKVFVNNHYGVLFNITNLLNKMKVNIEDLSISGDGQVKEMYFLLQVKDSNRLHDIIYGLKGLSDVIKIKRAF